MELICGKCNSKYRIADDKVVGRKVVKIRCRKCGTIIEKNNEEEMMFSPENLDGFNFDESKTTVYNKDDDNNSFNKPNEQLSFNDKTKAEKPKAKVKKNSFELTREIAIPKQFLDEKSKKQKSLGLQHSGNQNRPNLSSSNFNNNKISRPNNKIKSTNRPNDLERQEFYPEKEKGSTLLTIVFVLLIIITSAFIFILYRNNWKLDINDFPKMINNALNGTSATEKKKKLVSIDEQFLISPNVKINSYKNKKRKDLLVVSGTLKNISSSLKGLVTIRADVFNKKDNLKLLSKRVYAGNTFTKKQLFSFRKEIDLNAEYLQSGQNSINWNIARGKSIPFMIVFYSDKKININDINVKLKITSAQ